MARGIHETIESAKYTGGTIFEVSKLGTRVIPEWNISPPGHVEGEFAVGTDTPAESLERAMKPILDVTNRERGVLLN